MHSEDKIKVKTEQKQSTDFICTTCSKTYNKQSQLDTHIKMKHDKFIEKSQKPEREKQKQKENKQKQKQVSKKATKVQPRNRVLQMQQNDHEDTIYSYLGELGEKNQENSSREDLLLVDQNQRQSIQTNYSFNKVVRTPYQKQIVPINIIPSQWIQKTPHQDFIKSLVLQMQLLYNALQLQKQKWQFRDPMAPEEEAEDQFSLMEIRKLILNYPRRRLVLKFPHFSIFLLWIGRICKPVAWEEFFMILCYYLAEYENCEKEGRPSQRWDKFNTIFQGQSVKPYLSERLSICDQKTVKKFTQFFNKWVTLFDLVNDFC